MTEKPNFKGFKSDETTRRDKAATFLKRISDGDEAVDPCLIGEKFEYEMAQIEAIEGPLGMAWDRLADLLTQAKNDPLIEKNSTALDFLEIMINIACTANLEDDIDGVMQKFECVFLSQRAWINSINSKPSPEAMWWVKSEWSARPDRGQSKAAFARQYAPLVKDKFQVLITPDTISRDWLPKNS